MAQRLAEKGEQYAKQVGMSTEAALGWLVAKAEDGGSPLKNDCFWTLRKTEGRWRTGCGKEFQEDILNPEGEEITFCPCCGGEVDVLSGEEVSA
jgi:hypothetical protein